MAGSIAPKRLAAGLVCPALIPVGTRTPSLVLFLLLTLVTPR
jgi:hypothetical protein